MTKKPAESCSAESWQPLHILRKWHLVVKQEEFCLVFTAAPCVQVGGSLV